MYLHVNLVGHSQDNERYSTKGALGLAPIWREECSFLINFPELSFLYFRVTSQASAKSPAIAEQAVAVRNIRTGLRAVPLVSPQMEPLAHSFLLLFANFS